MKLKCKKTFFDHTLEKNILTDGRFYVIEFGGSATGARAVFWDDLNRIRVFELDFLEEYFYPPDHEYAVYADALSMLDEMCSVIQYVMNSNERINGWDKMHDAFYRYIKFKEGLK